MAEELPILVMMTALLPVTAGMLVLQRNPYHALVIRGILGAVAALVYALFGAADVALTEALVGTMLSITLYAIAVRSSLNVRLGVLQHQQSEDVSEAGTIVNNPAKNPATEHHTAPKTPPPQDLPQKLRTLLNQHYLRLELIPYPNLATLEQALAKKEIQVLCVISQSAAPEKASNTEPSVRFHLETRILRLYEILQSNLPDTVVSYKDLSALKVSATTKAKTIA